MKDKLISKAELIVFKQNANVILELAAKVAGISGQCISTGDLVLGIDIDDQDKDFWNPLDDEEDSKALVDSLSLEVEVDTKRKNISVRTPHGLIVRSDYEESKLDETKRRLIVMTVVSIGVLTNYIK